MKTHHFMSTCFLNFTLALVIATPCISADVVKPRETTESSVNGFTMEKVKPFTAVTVSGTVLSSSDHGGRVLIISLWGLTCGSCLEEMKALQPLYEEFSEQGLNIWAVNTEDISAGQIQNGLETREIEVSYDLIPDPGLKITKIFTNWFIPVTVIVDREGLVQYYKVGFNEADIEDIEAKVRVLIAH